MEGSVLWDVPVSTRVSFVSGCIMSTTMYGTSAIVIRNAETAEAATSNMTIAEMTEVIEQCHAFGTLQGVKWSPTSTGHDDERLAA